MYWHSTRCHAFREELHIPKLIGVASFLFVSWRDEYGGVLDGFKG
jgi:hypothetical protein